ncbi:hypothetical protein [Sphingomonas elodea]|uniref:hypothetical protein n=1 Tax=Sphingomonas elodea TaxID=179878 RepID=UPI001110A87D|nr:hypothetical protein [Sphingomonas elodea]
MLLPEDGLDRLIGQLQAMARADREAILARLEHVERQRVRARLRRGADLAQAPASPYSPDIAERIATADTTLTEAGRKALANFLRPTASLKMPVTERGSALSQTMSGLLRSWGRRP